MAPSAPRPPGRPRDPRTDDVILRVTQRHLARHGYGGMSVQAIAAEAGVTKPTIYRRWRGKADLATAALAVLQAEKAPPVSGHTRDDLIALLRDFERALLRPNGMAMLGTLLVEEERTPELIALFRERIVATRRRMVRDLLDMSAARGEIRPGADLETAVNLLIGAFYARYLAGDRGSSDWAARVVDTVWAGLAPAPSSSGAAR